jgi:uncharacterized protein YbgA (DUF1722 family)
VSDLFDSAGADARVRDFFAGPWTADELVRFHASEKVAVMAHSPALARELGRLVALQREHEPAELARRYRELHARAMEQAPTPGRQANALMHLAGHLKDSLASAERRELRAAIEDYRRGMSPISAPLALLACHLRATGSEWARSQSYLREAR